MAQIRSASRKGLFSPEELTLLFSLSGLVSLKTQSRDYGEESYHRANPAVNTSTESPRNLHNW